MVTRTWSAGAWDTLPIDGDTIVIADAVPPSDPDDLPAAGIYHVSQIDLSWDPPGPLIDDYVGAGTIGAIWLDANSKVCVASDFASAASGENDGNMLTIAGDCACDPAGAVALTGADELVVAGGITFTAANPVAGVTTGAANPSTITLGAAAVLAARVDLGGNAAIALGAGAAIVGLLKGNGHTVAWTIGAGARYVQTADDNVDLGGAAGGLAVELRPPAGSTLDLPRDLTALSLVVAAGCTLDCHLEYQTALGAGRCVEGAGTLADLVSTDELLAAEGLTIGAGCTNVIQTRGGTAPRTGTEI